MKTIYWPSPCVRRLLTSPSAVVNCALGNDASIGTAARAYANRSSRLRRDHQRGMMTITVDLPMDTGELVEKALDKARDDEPLAIPDLADTSWSMRQANAFVNMVNGYLCDNKSSEGSNDNTLVTIEEYDLPPAGGLLSVAEKYVTEPPAPVYLPSPKSPVPVRRAA